ncbi:hypothetical protein FACS189411_01280 [Bacteroidia bacterium]|nr:hypothetical protein FACS189411_01280 [Bacteroidia bacterium]
MNTNDYNRIEELIARFFEGGTTREEEKELYGFFAGENIPLSLVPYKPLFGYFEHGMPAGLSEMEKATTMIPRRKSLHPVWIVAVAASLLVAAFSILFFTNKQEAENPFEGSYIIRNGMRITDPDIIRPELEAALRLVALQVEENERLWEEIRDPYEAVIRQFPDEYSQEAVRNILFK